jgi:hypothetical protein
VLSGSRFSCARAARGAVANRVIHRSLDPLQSRRALEHLAEGPSGDSRPLQLKVGGVQTRADERLQALGIVPNSGVHGGFALVQVRPSSLTYRGTAARRQSFLVKNPNYRGGDNRNSRPEAVVRQQ